MSGDALRAHLARVADEAHSLGRPLLAAWREPAAPDAEPLAVFAGARGGERSFWSQPAQGLSFAACGAVASVDAAGPERFALAAAGARALFASLRSDAAPDAGAAPPEAAPALVGGFAFADEGSARGPWAGWPALRFALPAHRLVRARDTAWWLRVAHVAPGADVDALLAGLRASAPAPAAGTASAAGAPAAAATGAPGFAVLADRAPEAYRRGVRAALAAIARGDLEKVVLARACRVARRGGFDAAGVVRALAAAHPDCTLFALGAGGRAFVGATPERLVRRAGDRVLASALAGSAPRGRTPAEDERLARALRESKKEQAEHAVVRRAIVAALAPACSALDAPESPGLLQLDGIQHLHTPIEGRLRAAGAGDLLDLAGRLHPTPAVGGAPRAAARAFLAAHEDLDRGGYAGGVGWIAASGDGELAVALRCALLAGRRATLYAGAGIVEGSDPDAELVETRLKLRAALGALVEL